MRPMTEKVREERGQGASGNDFCAYARRCLGHTLTHACELLQLIDVKEEFSKLQVDKVADEMDTAVISQLTSIVSTSFDATRPMSGSPSPGREG